MLGTIHLKKIKTHISDSPSLLHFLPFHLNLMAVYTFFTCTDLLLGVPATKRDGKAAYTLPA